MKHTLCNYTTYANEDDRKWKKKEWEREREKERESEWSNDAFFKSK